MKAAILAFACALLGATGCATGGGMMAAQPQGEQRSGFGMMGAAQPAYTDSTVRPFQLDLLAAAARGDLQGVQDALGRGESVDTRNPAGATALLLASASGSLPVIQTLISAGADVNAAANDGRTPLSAATAGGYDEIARVLKASGARGAPGEKAPAGDGQWWKDGASH